MGLGDSAALSGKRAASVRATGTMIVDAAGRIGFCDAHAAGLFFLSSAEMMRRSIDDYLPDLPRVAPAYPARNGWARRHWRS